MDRQGLPRLRSHRDASVHLPEWNPFRCRIVRLLLSCEYVPTRTLLPANKHIVLKRSSVNGEVCSELGNEARPLNPSILCVCFGDGRGRNAETKSRIYRDPAIAATSNKHKLQLNLTHSWNIVLWLLTRSTRCLSAMLVTARTMEVLAPSSPSDEITRSREKERPTKLRRYFRGSCFLGQELGGP